MTNKNWANVPFDPKKLPFFYGWLILLWGTLGIICSVPGQTIGVSVFTEPLIEVWHISRDQLSLAYMFGTIGSSFLLPWAGKQYDKHGARVVALIAAIGLGLVLLILSQLDLWIVGNLQIHSKLFIVVILLFGFLLLRFFGQGVLTLASKNMMVQWFEKRRGFATGLSNIFAALSFSSAPVVLYYLIEQFSWRTAWQLLALVIGVGFALIVIIFFRHRPEDSGLLPDGNYQPSERKKKFLFPVKHQFTLREARRNLSFWVCTLILAMQGLYITAFTFHIVSIFEEVGFSQEVAITIFQPTAVVAVVVTLIGSNVSDYIPLKYLFFLKGMGAIIGIIGVLTLGNWDYAKEMIIVGNGIMGGLFSVLSAVTWPRYFGRTHLGAINGQFIMVVVFGSALGPILFSQSLTHFGNYGFGAWVCLVIYLGLTLASLKTKNPQLDFKTLENPLSA